MNPEQLAAIDLYTILPAVMTEAGIRMSAGPSRTGVSHSLDNGKNRRSSVKRDNGVLSTRTGRRNAEVAQKFARARVADYHAGGPDSGGLVQVGRPTDQGWAAPRASYRGQAIPHRPSRRRAFRSRVAVRACHAKLGADRGRSQPATVLVDRHPRLGGPRLGQTKTPARRNLGRRSATGALEVIPVLRIHHSRGMHSVAANTAAKNANKGYLTVRPRGIEGGGRASDEHDLTPLLARLATLAREESTG
jgi:hypothetical protein